MTSNNQKLSFSSFGFSTILFSFVMICVVTFSALSLITANSDYKLSKKVADKNKAYYEAEERIYDKLTIIDDILISARNTHSEEDDYYSEISKQLAQYGNIEINDTGYIFTFSETISDTNYLSVKLDINYPADENDAFYDILQWKSVYETEIIEDETLNLIE